jgi:hypothetical protein
MEKTAINMSAHETFTRYGRSAPLLDLQTPQIIPQLLFLMTNFVNLRMNL